MVSRCEGRSHGPAWRLGDGGGALFPRRAPASGAPLIAKDGKVYACYRTKGKAKGSVRLVAKKGKCRKGERKVTWNAVGQPGASGESGSGASPGDGGAPGAARRRKR